MKIVFWGTPRYAAENLINIVKGGHNVIAVVTQPDRKRGRGNKLSPSPVKQAASAAREYIKELQNFVLWHYQFGSKYDTPFWDYAKKISFKDDKFDAMLDYCKDTERVNLIPKGYGGSTNDYSMYGQWPAFSFKIWYDGMTRKEK